ncbi:MAG: histidine kinase [Gammaproteobacteria bacterium]|nr:histidine kinase [Gammaproteobacteria bacterium]
MENQPCAFSLQGRIFAAASLPLIVASSAPLLLLQLNTGPWFAWSASLLIALVLLIFLLNLANRSLSYSLEALHAGLLNFRDGAFSISLVRRRNNPFSELLQLYNEVGEILRCERAHIAQRELLLDTIIQSSPLALMLIDHRGHILYANTRAHHLLNNGKAMQGLRLKSLLSSCPVELARAIEQQQDGLFSYRDAGWNCTLHVSNSAFNLNMQPHRLILLKEMSQELTRAEIQVWKKAIRLVSHELNNSLAPISSMAFSGKQLSLQAPQAHALAQVFDVIAERCQHLTEFTQGYARFARLPSPSCKAVPWQQLINNLQPLQSFLVEGEIPAQRGYFDPVQIEQALLNLLKNAAESGSAPEHIALAFKTDHQGQLLSVRDRGSGMSEKGLQQALLPFYSTKTQGVGLGLALCNEIVEAHNGKLQLYNRAQGGLQVNLWLPWAQLKA